MDGSISIEPSRASRDLSRCPVPAIAACPISSFQRQQKSIVRKGPSCPESIAAGFLPVQDQP